MSSIKTIAWMIAAPACLLGVAGVASAQSGQGQAAAAGPQCTVTVDRGDEANVFDVARQEFSDGSCECFVYTGPAGQSAAIENQVASLLQSRRCPGARLAQATGGSGIGSEALLVIGSGAGFAGIIAGLSQNNEDDLPPSP